MTLLFPESILRPNEGSSCTDCGKTYGWLLFGKFPVGNGNVDWYKCNSCNVEWCDDCGKGLETTSRALVLKTYYCKLCTQKVKHYGKSRAGPA